MALKKMFLGLLSLAALAGLAGLGTLFFRYPAVGPAPSLTVEMTPERLARGTYLAEHVGACIGCHSQRDWTKFGGPLKEGSLGKGGEFFGPAGGFPGRLFSRNITPAALGSWSDGELFRALTTGVSRDGYPLFPLMPYQRYAHVAREDLYALIAYVRSLPPVPNEIPARRLDFPLNLLVRTMPADSDPPQKAPVPADGPAYGAYVANLASCTECHTPTERGAPVAGKAFSGGHAFRMPTGGTVRSANITPHETGIGSWSKERFIARFKAYENPELFEQRISAGEFNTIMPWVEYAGMTEEDLGAVYDYLRTVAPVENRVERFTPPG